MTSKVPEFYQGQTFLMFLENSRHTQTVISKLLHLNKPVFIECFKVIYILHFM